MSLTAATTVRPQRRASWVAHALLGIGTALLYVATLLPWGVTASGSLIMLQSPGIPGLATQSAPSALNVADTLIYSIGGCAIGLILCNLALRGLHMLLREGCIAKLAVLMFYPFLIGFILSLAAVLLIASGVGGYGPLSQLPVTGSYGTGGLGMAHYELGYYAWYTGLMVNVVGMLGEFFVWRSGRAR